MVYFIKNITWWWFNLELHDNLFFSHSLVVFLLWDVHWYQPIPHSAVRHVYMLCTNCIASECYWLSVGDSPPYGRLSCRSTVHFFARLKVLDSCVRKYKRCSFSWVMDKYSTSPRNKVFVLFLEWVLYFSIPPRKWTLIAYHITCLFFYLLPF